MKKIFIRLLIIIPIIFIIGCIILYFSLNNIVKKSVTTLLPKITKTKVTMGSINISPFSGKVIIKDFAIANPEHFTTKNFMSTKKITVQVNLKSLFSDKIIINEIEIQTPEITYEKTLTSSNLKEIKDNIAAFIPPAKEIKDDKQKNSKSGKKIQLDHFAVTTGKIHLHVKMIEEGLAMTLPDIELNDIGKDSDKPNLKEVIIKSTDVVFKTIAETLIKNDKLKGQLDDILNSFEDKGKDIVNEGKNILDSGKDIKDNVQGLFKGGLFGK